MHDDGPEAKREPGELRKNVSTITKASVLLAVVAGLTSVIYLVAREYPKNFPVLMPAESQDPPPKDEPVKKAPQPH